MSPFSMGQTERDTQAKNTREIKFLFIIFSELNPKISQKLCMIAIAIIAIAMIAIAT